MGEGRSEMGDSQILYTHLNKAQHKYQNSHT